MSLALREDLKRLDCILLPGRSKAGTFGWGQAKEECDMPLPEGDMGGVNDDGDIMDAAEGDPGKRFMAEAKSMAAAPDVPERGEGTAEPVDTYNGRSSSTVWAKKQTLLAQFVPSLHSRVLY